MPTTTTTTILDLHELHNLLGAWHFFYRIGAARFDQAYVLNSFLIGSHPTVTGRDCEGPVFAYYAGASADYDFFLADERRLGTICHFYLFDRTAFDSVDGVEMEGCPLDLTKTHVLHGVRTGEPSSGCE